MNSNIDLREVKKYNESLKKYQDAAAQVRAGIEFNKKELARLCSELSQELGVTVTPENIEAIREERVAKALNTLSVGNEILDRIRKEEAQDASSSIPASVAQPTVAQPGFAQPGFVPAPPVFTPPAQPQAQSQPAADNTFANIGNIPPMFGNQ